MKPVTPPLAIKSRAAAKMLGVSLPTLWSWCKTGFVPHVRIDNMILFHVGTLDKWLADKAAESVKKIGGEL